MDCFSLDGGMCSTEWHVCPSNLLVFARCELRESNSSGQASMGG